MNHASKTFFAGTGLVCGVLMLGPAGCDTRTSGTNNDTPSTSRAPGETDRGATKSTDPKAPDNTGVNERDRNSAKPTPESQGQTQRDLDITAEIRKAIMADNTMSVNAQNCKIITTGGVVTLRGPVESQSEKDAIAAKARGVAGVSSVQNELEVKIK